MVEYLFFSLFFSVDSQKQHKTPRILWMKIYVKAFIYICLFIFLAFAIYFFFEYTKRYKRFF